MEKCSRLRERFVEEEIGGAAATALQTVIGLSKGKQFKWHRRSALASDFPTEGHASSSPRPLPPPRPLPGLADAGGCVMSSPKFVD